MKTIYWNTDTDIMVMPTGLIDLQKVAELDPRIKTVSNDNGMDIVSCGCYGTGSAVLSDIDYDPKATDSYVKQCWHEKDKSRIPYVRKETIIVENDEELPKEVEELLRKYCD